MEATKANYIAGTPFVGSGVTPREHAAEVKPVRMALWDRQGGSMTSGWTRWLLERFEFPFRVVKQEDLEGDALAQLDVLILVDDAMVGQGMSDLVPQFKKFLERGGTILAVGGATTVGKQMGLVKEYLAEKDEEGNTVKLPREKFYVPSSVLRVTVNNTHPLAWGMAEEADVMFSNSPTFRLTKEPGSDLTRLAWFDSKTPLRSGWVYGQHYLDGATAMVEARVGKGRLALFGPQITFRGQPHGTFKLLFNGIVQAGTGG